VSSPARQPAQPVAGRKSHLASAGLKRDETGGPLTRNLQSSAPRHPSGLVVVAALVMRTLCAVGGVALVAPSARAADLKIDLGQFHLDEAPPGFRSAVTGKGKPGDWKVVLADVPPLLEPLTPNAPAVTGKAVLAQLAQDPTDEHFPLLIYEGESFGDFTLKTRFKIVRGVQEQMAGVASRLQDETNYYVIRASTLGSTFRFYKVVNGQRGELIGPKVDIASGVWHNLQIQCTGNKIDLQLDGKQLIPTLTDDTFVRGKIGFWTKSDSVSYFTDTEITYTRREVGAQVLVKTLLKKYPKLLGLRVYVAGKEAGTTRVVASKYEAEIGQAGGATEQDVLRNGTPYYSKNKQLISVIMPLRDRNGEIMAAARVEMKPFVGETIETAINWGGAIVKDLQGRVTSLDDLE